MKQLYFSVLIALFCLPAVAQNTNISGVVNSYTSVSAVSGNDVTVASSAAFSAGDRVLLIQMQGATIDETNAATFGDISNLGNAGNYEFSTVCAIPNGTTLTLIGVQRSYDASGVVQLVHVPQYVDATVTGTLTASPWDGTTGGILAFECSGDLTLNSDIDVEGLGFRGGTVTTSNYSCAWFSNVTDYFYDISSGEGAMKGEGIAQYISGKTGGRGPQANGGGGSNDHNGGGGGGSNAGAGGIGGERVKPSTFTCQCIAPGEGGNDLIYSNAANNVFLGGGGGAGHENNPATATAGGNGGGIVIIRANTLVGNGNAINASGADVTANSADGAGGAGAGGTVLLDIPNYNTGVTVNATGGNGGNVANIGPSNCNGPGGGGGGGLLWVSPASISGGITLLNTGGANGTTIATIQSNCTLNGANGAQPGNTGSSLTNLAIVDNACNVAPITTSASICAGDSLFLAGAWQTTSGTYNDTASGTCCDTIYSTTLAINTANLTPTASSICQGDSLFLEGAWQTAAGVYRDTLQNVSGCDSIIETTLATTSSYTVSNNQSICDNDSLFLEGAWQTVAGTYVDSYLTASNCDSIVTTTLAVNPSYFNTSNATICDVDSIFLEGAWQNTAGTYTDSYNTGSGCDSIVETVLAVTSSYASTANVSMCDNDSIFLEGIWQTIGGTFTGTYQTSGGCDSVVTTVLTLDLTYQTTDQISIWSYDSAYLAGAWQNQKGSYVDTFASVDGCDSVVTTDLWILTGLPEQQRGDFAVSVYPNPFSTTTTIDFSDVSNRSAMLRLYTSTGKLARIQQLPAGGKATLQRNGLANGLYFFEVEIDGIGTAFGKLMLE